MDSEIKRLLDESYAATATVLEANQPLLEAIAEALLERETLDAEDIKRLEQGRELPAPAPEPTPPAPRPAAVEPVPQRERPLEGAGGEPAPAPA